eukprot:3430501-Amphidinium_carterae.2
MNAALGGVWHEVYTHNAFAVGDLCVRCKEEVEDLPHIKERRQVELPADDDATPACVRKRDMACCLRHGWQWHGCRQSSRSNRHWSAVLEWVLSRQMDLVNTAVTLIQHRRCGVAYYTNPRERTWLPLPGIKQICVVQYHAEFIAVMRALMIYTAMGKLMSSLTKELLRTALWNQMLLAHVGLTLRQGVPRWALGGNSTTGET